MLRVCGVLCVCCLVERACALLLLCVRFSGWLVGRSVARLFARLACLCVSWNKGWSVVLLVGCVVYLSVGCLFCCV